MRRAVLLATLALTSVWVGVGIGYGLWGHPPKAEEQWVIQNIGATIIDITATADTPDGDWVITLRNPSSTLDIKKP